MSDRSVSELQQELAQARAEIEFLKTELGRSERLRHELEAKLKVGSSTDSQVATLAEAGAFGFVPFKNGKDNLLTIEGIGPKIRDLLAAQGIHNFNDLASTPVNVLQDIIDWAGPTFRLAKPASWPTQANMCLQRDWAGLRALQDELVAGVNPQSLSSRKRVARSESV